MEWFAAPEYDAARWLFVRLLAVIYLIGFVNILRQWRPLLGTNGLTPAPRFLAAVSFRRAPSLFHWRYSDGLALALAWAGGALAAATVAGLTQKGPVWVHVATWLTMFLLYLSFVNIGQTWYAFGWESITLEAGFLTAFLGSEAVAPPLLTVLLLRWLLFRIEFGAGLIKLRGDPCWRDLTCLEYHHETQPIPNAFSWFAHHLPRWAHRVEVGANHVTQLVVPFGLFLPQPVATAAGVVILVTQGWLVLSGNFAWLNLVTMSLAVLALDDRLLGSLVPAVEAPTGTGPVWFVGLGLAVSAAFVVMSWWPVRNLLSRHQRMNASFNPFHLVGTYGAFGSVTRTRYELVFEATRDPEPGPGSDWRPYRFRGKPTDLDRRPAQVAPYHLRLDWLLWFAAMSPQPRDRWLLRFVDRLLEADPSTLSLVRSAPFEGRPTAVRVLRYRYRFTTPAERRATGEWWVRDRVATYLPPRRAGDVTSG